MKLVLDANALISDFNLGGSKFRLLFDHVKRSGDGLCVPEIAFDETVRKYQEQLEDAHRAMASGSRAASRLLGRKIEAPLTSDAIAEEVEVYRKFLRQTLQRHGTEILPYPKVSHADVVKRLLAERRPFKDGEKGYRDCLLWETLLETARKQVATALVSDNTRDFADDDRTRLHPDLCEDLKALGLADGAVCFFAGLDKLVDIHVRPTLARLAELARQINDEQYAGFNLRTWLDENLLVAIGDHELDGFGSFFSEAHLSAIGDIESAEVFEASKSGEDEVLLDLIVRFEADCDFFIQKSDYNHLDESTHKSIRIDDPDWNDHVMSAGMPIVVEARFSVTLNTKTGEVTSTDIWDLSRVVAEEK